MRIHVVSLKCSFNGFHLKYKNIFPLKIRSIFLSILENKNKGNGKRLLEIKQNSSCKPIPTYHVQLWKSQQNRQFWWISFIRNCCWSNIENKEKPHIHSDSFLYVLLFQDLSILIISNKRICEFYGFCA